jgi:hypothetical protein
MAMALRQKCKVPLFASFSTENEKDAAEQALFWTCRISTASPVRMRQ